MELNFLGVVLTLGGIIPAAMSWEHPIKWKGIGLTGTIIISGLGILVML